MIVRNTFRRRLAAACRCVMLTGLALVPSPVPAQDTPAFTVTVTEPADIVQAVGTTRRVTRAEIDARHATTLDEALRLVPGIYVRTGGDGTPRIDVRGFRSRHVLLLIDGVPYNSTVDGQFDPARFSTESIREITVSYGSGSVLYGDNAMAAVIEVATTSARSPVADLDVTGMTPAQGGAGGRFAQSYGRFDVAVTGNVFENQGYRLPSSFEPTPSEDGGRRNNSDRARRDFRANIGWTIAPTLRLGTEWTLGGGSYGVPPSTISNANDIFAQAVRYDRIDDYQQASGQVALVFAPAPRMNLQAWAYRNTLREDAARYDDASYSSIDDPLVPGTFQSRDRSRISGSAVLGRLDLRHAGWLRLGMNQRRESFDSEGVIRDVVAGSPGGGATSGGGGGGGGGGGVRPPATYGLRPFAVDQHLDVYSAGAEWQFQPVDKLGAVLGTAANWQNRVNAAGEVEPTWIAGVTYDARQTVRLHASVTRKIRFPSIDQLYNASSGNADLAPEHAYGVDGGVSRTWRNATRISVSAFRTTAENFIERDAGARFTNRDRYRFTGVEGELDARPLAGLELRTAYTFLDSVDLTPGAGEAELQYRPRHRAMLDAQWRFSSRLSAGGTVEGVADQKYYSRGATPVQASADDYVLVGGRVTYQLSTQYEVMAGVTNLFDVLYEQSYGLPREGRTAFLTLRARFR